MKQQNQDSRFEQFRRDRNLRRAQASAESTEPTHRHTTISKALEAAEARELRDQTLTREVHEFFADATRVAASIVQKFSEKHADEKGGRVSSEMEDFLRDAIRRAETFIQMLRKQGQGPEAEKHLHILGTGSTLF